MGAATPTESKYAYLGGTLLAEIDVSYSHNDGLGSPIARTNGVGGIVSRTRYEPYGYVSAGTTPTIGYAGHVNDAYSGLVYMQQRYYDPLVGRFMSMDPVVTDANTAASFNRYIYANINPYKYVDPDGRFGVIGALIGGSKIAMEGRVTNWTAVGVSSAVGAVTGGLGGIIGKAAASGTVATGRAVLAAGAVSGAASATGKVVEGQLTGKAASSGEVAVAAAAGAAGGAAGTKIGLSAITAVESMAGRAGIAGHVGATTQAAMQQGDHVVEPSTTAGQAAGQRAVDVISTYAEKKVNQ